MKVLLTAPAVALVALLGPLPAAVCARAEPGTGAANASPVSPPFIDHAQWAQWHGLPSLRVFPTPSGRAASRQAGAAASGADADEAWSEVLRLAPDADTPGMRAQFVCHWQFAELALPGKTSWNLEPWRPVVDDAEMVATGCNPGGPEEAF
ncbi:DUF2599 domain-containing protein [Mycobacterium sp. 050134]|uniref:DUF2599 domain-containing protein n=1 Tax=Mycobacterium sp. 050134 TaxID=3096111 RepID=UPI002EDA6CDF